MNIKGMVLLEGASAYVLGALSGMAKDVVNGVKKKYTGTITKGLTKKKAPAPKKPSPLENKVKDAKPMNSSSDYNKGYLNNNANKRIYKMEYNNQPKSYDGMLPKPYAAIFVPFAIAAGWLFYMLSTGDISRTTERMSPLYVTDYISMAALFLITYFLTIFVIFYKKKEKY